MRSSILLGAVVGLALAAACHSAPPPEPAPTPVPPVAMNLHPVDTLSDASRRTADSLAWQTELAAAEKAYSDSVAQVRSSYENGGRQAAEKSAELRRELGVMVYFDVGQTRIQPDGRDALDRKVAILKANPAVRLRITGGCDERGSDQYNVALGERRAAAVKHYLGDKGISVARLDQASSGESTPIDSGNNEAAWVQNRRAEFSIVSPDVPLAMN